MNDNDTLLKERLDRLYRTFDMKYLSPDPLEFVHRFKSRSERELVGLIASSLAYGRVEQIRKSIERVLDAVEWRPLEFTLSFEPKEAKKLFKGFVHRFNDGTDICTLFYYARHMIETEGSIGAFFKKGFKKEDETIKEALASFSERILAIDARAVLGARTPAPDASVRFFFPSPAKKSPCKRLNLYLRWMIRPADGLDFGLWKGIPPSKLIIPLDTHIARISQNIGLTTRKSPDWRMAEEITASLGRLDPEDPVKYDFAICRLGILERCKKDRDPTECEKCLIKEICVL